MLFPVIVSCVIFVSANYISRYSVSYEKINVYKIIHWKVNLSLSLPQWRIGGEEVKNWPFLTSALGGGGEWSTSRSSHFTRGKEPRYLLSRRLAGTQTQCGRIAEDKNILALPASELRTVQLVAWSIHRIRWPCFHIIHYRANYCTNAKHLW